jgi:hypothetical protein
VTDRAPERLAALAGLVAAAAGAVLVLGSARRPAEAAASAEFQRAVLGLGGGTAGALEPCEAAFHGGGPSRCARSFEPVPGGESFCPHHAGAALRR